MRLCIDIGWSHLSAFRIDSSSVLEYSERTVNAKADSGFLGLPLP